MTTDTFTLPRRALLERDALVDRDDPAAPPRRELPIDTDDRRPVAQPSHRKRGAWPLVRLLLSHDGRQPTSDPLLLLGPNGGPLWTSRTW